MSVGKSLGQGAMRAVGSNLTNQALSTPEGHAMVVATAAGIIAAAPAVLTLAGLGLGAYGVIQAADYLDGRIAQARKEREINERG